MEALEPFAELKEVLIESGGETLKSCFRCGTCTATCPWNLVMTFMLRRMIQKAQFGISEDDVEEIWVCSGCRACMDRCPRGVEIIDVVRAMRRVSAEFGAIPKPLRGAITSIKGEGNPWLSIREKRMEWAKDIEVPKFSAEKEFLLFICCTNCYDPRNIKVAKSMLTILDKTKTSFGTLGEDESCCSEAIRKAGAEEVFEETAKKNIKLFKENEVEKILTNSPHCYHTFSNEYEELDGKFEIKHVTKLFNELVKEGKLKLDKELKKRVTYHDPCYLGRHNDIYDEPRELLTNIPGFELIEMPNNRENSICCGGGAGGIWLEREMGQRICDKRIEQALEVGAEILATSCPYCISNFEDSVKTLNKEEELKIYDVTELVELAISG